MKKSLLFSFFLIYIVHADIIITNNSNKCCELNWEKLNVNPKKGVKFLIDNLSIINTNYISRENNMKPIMDSIIYLKALRTLTVTDFTAQTTYIFDSKKEIERTRAYFMNMCGSNNIPFYRFWMSRTYYFIAPIDAQRKIIDKWKEWYKDNADTWHYNTNKIIKEIHSPYPEIENM